MDSNYLGEIRVFSFNRIPGNWLPCNGQVLPIKQYQALFSLLSNLYGGDGKTNFQLPNLQGRTMIGFGVYQQDPQFQFTQAQAGGAEGVTLTAANLPAHTHQFTIMQESGNVLLDHTTAPVYRTAITNVPQITTEVINTFVPSIGAKSTPLHPGSVSKAGGNQAHSNLMPFLPLTVCIATAGMWPSRSN
ncbi:MAG: tail fiber protein [Chitinophagaceae bacterium]